MTLICDTSGLLAALDTNEKQHRPCAAALAKQTNVVVSPLVLAELDYLVTKRIGANAMRGFYEDVADGVYEVGLVSNSAITDARELDIRHADFGIGLTDAVNVVLARDYHTNRILTLDKHYRSVAPLSRHAAFQLLPADS